MLENQTFVDPQLANQVKQLEKQMKSLLQQKLQIQYNTQFIDDKRRAQMLKTNEEQRLDLRRIIQNSKLAMVQYFDKQIKVVSIDCMKQGSLERRSRQKFDPSRVMKQPIFVRQEQTQSEEDTQEQCKKSRQSQSTNYKSKIYHYQEEKSFQYLNSFDGDKSEGTRQNLSDSYEKGSKICLSTGCRTNGREQKVGKASIRSREKEAALSGLNMSLIENANNNSSIMEVNEFNVTAASIPPILNEASLPYPNAKSSLLYYLHQQPPAESQSQLAELTSLFQTKISCLQQKCLSLETQNAELLQIVDYQEATIHELDVVISEKEREIGDWKARWRISQDKYSEGHQCWKERFEEVVDDLKSVIEVIERHKDKICLSIITNQIISKYKPVIGVANHLPLTLSESPVYQRPSTLPLSQIPNQFLESNSFPCHFQGQKIQITELSRQLVDMQLKLKQIQDENQQLKGERRLLLRKVKI